MAIQFILGTSGSGKTRWCIDAIAEALRQPDDRPLVFLVPEQDISGGAGDFVLSGYCRVQSA